MKILLPTDGSEISRNACTYGLSLFENVSIKEITLLNTYKVPGSSADTLVNLDELLKKESDHLLAEEEAFLQGLSKAKGTKVIKKGTYGLLIDTIKRFEENSHYDLVLMGTRSEKGAIDKVFGSPSIELSEVSKFPILYVPENFQLKSIKKILFFADFKDYDKETIRPIFDKLAGSQNFNLDIVHVSDHELNEDEAFQGTLLDEIFSEIPHHFRVIGQDHQEELTKEIENNQYQLIVTVKRKHSFFDRILNKSFTRSLLLDCNMPLLVFPEKE